MDKIFAIIVIYNGMQRDWIQKCFESLRQSTEEINIIAVDNCSSDESVDYIRTHYSEVILIRSDKNLGFGGANNLGLKKALALGGDYFFLLNQDAWVEPNTIGSLVRKVKENPQYGILSPMHLNGKGDALDYNFSLQINPAHCLGLYSDIYLNLFHNKLYEANFVCAAAWLVTKKCLENVGGFSPAFFHYGEDDNYCHRLKFLGMKIGVYPAVKIFHDREDRKNDVNADNCFFRRKLMTIKYMDPNHNLDIQQEINRMCLQQIKSIIRMNINLFSEISGDIKFLKNLKRVVLQYKSNDNQKFKYLQG